MRRSRSARASSTPGRRSCSATTGRRCRAPRPGRLPGGAGRPLHRVAPDSDRAARAALADAVAAAEQEDGTALALARGAARAAIYGGSYQAAIDALGDDDAKDASGWLLIREFRTATRFSRPGVERHRRRSRSWHPGDLSPEQAQLAVEKDLLDAYQARTREILEEAGDAEDSGFAARRAERAALAAGYWSILADRFQEQRGAAAAKDARQAFDRLVATGAARRQAVHRGSRAPPTRSWPASPPRRSPPRRRHAAPSSSCASSTWSRSSTAAAWRTARSPRTSRCRRRSRSATAPSPRSSTC